MPIDSRSRAEDILHVTLGDMDPSVLQPPQSRVEVLLQRLYNEIGETGGKIKIHICSSDEYDHESGMPTVEDPEENVFYLVPTGTETDDMYDEWIFTVGNRWEKFGSGGGGSGVSDVQVNGVSVVTDGVANVPIATNSNFGLVKLKNGDTGYGLDISAGSLSLNPIDNNGVKRGLANFRPICPDKQHLAAFYGLAKAAGSDEINSTLPAGSYTESAKSAISEMLGGSIAVTGTTPSITALPGVRYVCGEVSTIDITVPATGIIDVVFTSGSTPAVLTVTPTTGVTMKWANGFDPDHLDANTVYEINIMDGCYGVVGTWT